MWHIDTTVIRLLDGTRAYLHAVIDNFSRRVLAWRVAETFAPMNSVTVLLDATRGAVGSTTAPVVLADAGVENVNAAVDALIETGVLRRLLAFTELRFSNSMIEAWWRSLKHQWLYLHSLDSVATIRRLVTFYVHEHNQVLPHSAFRGQTPDEMYFGTGEAVPEELTSRARPPRAEHVWRPTDPHLARRARQSTRPHDRGGRPLWRSRTPLPRRNHERTRPRRPVRGPATLSESSHLRLSITPCRTEMARTRPQKSRMSVKRARMTTKADIHSPHVARSPIQNRRSRQRMMGFGRVRR
jgi:hypothetical protein